MLKKILTKSFIKQFLSYFCVGGIAAIVEWVMFFLFNTVVHIDYVEATILAFFFSTTANWILGRSLTFRNSAKYKGKELKEVVLVFIVSLVGLGFNLVLMYLFVQFLGMNTDFLRTLAKILSTGIVFVWNFMARKIIVYRV